MTYDLRQRIRIARGEIPADLVLHNAQLINVCSGECYLSDVAITQGRVIGMTTPDDGYRYQGKVERDLQGRWLAPGLIDGHMHIESTMLSLPEFARIVTPLGVTTIVIDPHEFANVMGVAGIRLVLDSSRVLPLSVYIMLSSCVPASSFESPQGVISADDLLPLLNDERVLGLAELGDMRGVLLGDEQILAKIEATLAKGLVVDGHAPGLKGPNLCGYIVAGAMSDHECTRLEEARQRIRMGMWLMIREGSVAHNMETLLPLIKELHPPRAFFVTDDRDPHDLIKRGHIDSMVRHAIELGIDPVEAIRLASYNTAQYFRLYDRGAIVPGFVADLVVLDNLSAFHVESVYKDGTLIAQGGEIVTDRPPSSLQNVSNSVCIGSVSESDLRIVGHKGLVEVIGIEPEQITTQHLQEEALVQNNQIVADPERDLLKLAVIERHHASGRIGLGLVKGFGIKKGALASSVAHDAHNIIIVGANDTDMSRAALALKEIGGGFVLVVDGELMASVSLPLGGLISLLSIDELVQQLSALDAAVAEMGCRLNHPAMALSFLSLSVIPSLKLTDQGLIDVDNSRLIPLQS